MLGSKSRKSLRKTPEPNILFPDTLHKGRLIGVLSTQGAIYVGSLTGLYFLWYKDYAQSNFHFFNDNSEWLQMDKMGHFLSSYYLSRVVYNSYRWAGVKEGKSIIFGSLLAYAFMLNIEILDGFSAGWGFSVGDLAANTAGCLLFMGQQFGWHEQRFMLKYSYHPSKYPKYNPELLGNNIVQNMVKDYNGMSVWLSGNIYSFLPRESKFPKWLNVAVGYGAEGLGVNVPGFDKYRKFFLSVDVDLTRIPTRSKVLKGIFTLLNIVKIPFPALEYNTKGQFKFHPLYF
ncbi:MAG: DUF2279 domain-containing protein [Bacteroidales bacterium]|nr:DUF2279 domain-containing protein [Bacteroidales bacterium]